jgi:hypothetical protein
MITNTEIRNALTGALAIMALGLFASCSETPVAPVDQDPAVHAPAADSTQLSLQSCTLVDGVWVSTSGGGGATTSSGGTNLEHCRTIGGVLYCPPDGMS